MAVIYDLCSGTGSWSQPYVDAGYDVVRVDIEHGQDVRLLEAPGKSVHGILGGPPCTDFASSGARWWKGKGQGALLDALSVADACLRFAQVAKPKWWALENPVGRLRRYWGEPSLIFDPCDYGDPYTKKTLLWGDFKHPKKSPVAPVGNNPIHFMSPGQDRAKKRSITPPGFARAFFEANP